MLLSVINFFKALWQRAAQYINILDRLKGSEKFWKPLSNSISLTSSVDSPSPDSLSEMQAQNLAYRYQCQSAIMELIACDMFLQKKMLHVESVAKQAPESRGRVENSVNTEKSKAANLRDLKDILSTWCKNSVLVYLIKSLTHDYSDDSFYRAKVTIEIPFAFLLIVIYTYMHASTSVCVCFLCRSVCVNTSGQEILKKTGN